MLRRSLIMLAAVATVAGGVVPWLHGGDSAPAGAAVPGAGEAAEGAAGDDPGRREGDRPRFGARPAPAPAPSPARASLLDSAPQRVAAPEGRAPADARGLIAKVHAGARLQVRNRPGGRPVGRVGDRTQFGSRTALTVFETRANGRWIGVATNARPAGRLGWIRVREGALDWYRTDRSLHIDLSERRMELREGRRVLRRTRVGIGRPATPTPTGRFGVTDRLLGTDYGWWYGCCIIAFTGVQPNLPAGWQGGNRIAVHGAASRSSIGAAVSAGCLRAPDEVLRHLMTEVPLGTPVHISA